MPSIRSKYAKLSHELYVFLRVDAITPTLADGFLSKMMTALNVKGSGAKDAVLVRDLVEMRELINNKYHIYNDDGIFCDHAAWHDLCVNAWNDTDFIHTVEKTIKSPQAYEVFALMAAIFNENTKIENKKIFFEPVGQKIRSFLIQTSYSQEWLMTRSPIVRALLTSDILEILFTYSELPAPVHNISSFDTLIGSLTLHPQIPMYYLFSGQFDKAIEVQNALDSEDKEDHASSQLLQGMIHFMQGNFADAEKFLSLGQKALRSFFRRPSLQLIGCYGTALQLARLALGDAKSLKILRDDCKKLKDKYDESQLDVRPILALEARLCGDEAKAYMTLYSYMMSDDVNILSTVLYYTVAKQIPYQSIKNIETSQFIAMTICTYIEKTERFLHDICPKFPMLNRLLHDALAIDDISYARKASDTQYVNLTTIVKKAPVWEAKLNALAQITEKSSKNNAGRLAWLINRDIRLVQPIEQKLQKNGGWSAGRNIGVKRLLEEGQSLAWATEQDKKAFAGIKREDSWYSATYSFSFSRTLPLLVGHPLVFDDDTREPIQIEQNAIQLHLTQNANDCLLAMSHNPTETEMHFGFMCTQKENVLSLISIPQSWRTFLTMLGHDGLHFPAEALPRVIDIARQSGIALAMHIESENVQADSTPIIQIQQRGQGFIGSLKVRPFTVLGSPLYTPTQGQTDVVAALSTSAQDQKSDATRPVCTTRDFAAEQKAADALFAACPSLEENASAWQLCFNTPQELLQALQELQVLQEEKPDSTPFILEWPKGEQIRLRGNVSPSHVKISLNKKGDWFALEGEIRISEHDVLRLSTVLDAMKGSDGNFVPLGNGEFLRLSQDLQKKLEQLEHLAQKTSGKRGAKNDELFIHPLAAESLEKNVADFDFKADTHWKETVSRMEEAFAITPELPRSLQATLRPYQQEGFEWLCRLAHWGVGACLADDMGLGKTVQTIATMLSLAHEGPCLVVAPTSVCSNWESELARFAPSLNVHRLGAASTRKGLIENLKAQDVLIVGYGLLHNEIKHLAACSWRMAIFDEAQALKNATTKRAKAGHSIEAKFKLALTGTPVENRLDDVWSLFNTINAGLLGTADTFRQRFGSGDKAAMKTLRALLRPFILRRLKSHVLDELPTRTEQTIIIEPSAQEEAYYEVLRRRAVEALENTEETAGQRRLHIFAELTRLRRACCHPTLADNTAQDVLTGPSSKMAHFLEMLEDLRATGHKMLVFSQFVDHLHLVRNALVEKGISFQYLDGSTPEKTRAKSVADFQNGEGDVFLISLRAGGQGLNLTAADYVFHLDPWWNPAVEDQASDRAHRMGQLRPVTIYRLVMARSVEEKILALHQQKRDLAANFLANTDSGAMALSEKELMDLFIG